MRCQLPRTFKSLINLTDSCYSYIYCHWELRNPRKPLAYIGSTMEVTNINDTAKMLIFHGSEVPIPATATDCGNLKWV